MLNFAAIILVLLSFSNAQNDDTTDTTDYKPSPLVVAAHNIPHLSTHLTPESNTFNVSTESLGSITSSNGYLASLIPFPAILLALGVLAILIFLFSMCLRCCSTYMKCAPEEVRVSLSSFFPKVLIVVH